MKPEVVIAICALVVSIFSLATSGYFSWCIRDHNRRSVKPLPYISASDFEDRLSVRILNNGIGPLILQKVIAFHKDDKDNNKLGSQLIDLVSSLPSNVCFSNFTKILSGMALLPGNKLDLIDIEINLNDPEAIEYRNILRDLLGNLAVAIHYTDIYDSQFPVYKRYLDWFHRDKITSRKQYNKWD